MNLFDLFKKAEQTLSHPSLTFPISENQQIKVAVCSKKDYIGFPNYLYFYLLQDSKFPGTYLGKVTKKNELILSPATFQDKNLKETVMRLFKEPQELCMIQGRRFSFCCFCGTKIESKDSLAVGYGPICAEKWGLPWGETTTILSKVGQALANSHETNSN